MSNRSKAKGDRGELEVQAIFDGAGFEQAQRPRAGATHDRGDMAGIPDLTVQVKNIDDLARAIGDGMRDLAEQRENNRTTWGMLAIKRRRKGWLAVQPLEEWAALYARMIEAEAVASWARNIIKEHNHAEQGSGDQEVRQGPAEDGVQG